MALSRPAKSYWQRTLTKKLEPLEPMGRRMAEVKVRQLAKRVEQNEPPPGSCWPNEDKALDIVAEMVTDVRLWYLVNWFKFVTYTEMLLIIDMWMLVNKPELERKMAQFANQNDIIRGIAKKMTLPMMECLIDAGLMTGRAAEAMLIRQPPTLFSCKHLPPVRGPGSCAPIKDPLYTHIAAILGGNAGNLPQWAKREFSSWLEKTGFPGTSLKIAVEIIKVIMAIKVKRPPYTAGRKTWEDFWNYIGVLTHAFRAVANQAVLDSATQVILGVAKGLADVKNGGVGSHELLQRLLVEFSSPAAVEAWRATKGNDITKKRLNAALDVSSPRNFASILLDKRAQFVVEWLRKYGYSIEWPLFDQRAIGYGKRRPDVAHYYWLERRNWEESPEWEYVRDCLVKWCQRPDGPCQPRVLGPSGEEIEQRADPRTESETYEMVRRALVDAPLTSNPGPKPIKSVDLHGNGNFIHLVRCEPQLFLFQPNLLVLLRSFTLGDRPKDLTPEQKQELIQLDDTERTKKILGFCVNLEDPRQRVDIIARFHIALGVPIHTWRHNTKHLRKLSGWKERAQHIAMSINRASGRICHVPPEMIEMIVEMEFYTTPTSRAEKPITEPRDDDANAA